MQLASDVLDEKNMKNLQEMSKVKLLSFLSSI